MAAFWGDSGCGKNPSVDSSGSLGVGYAPYLGIFEWVVKRRFSIPALTMHCINLERRLWGFTSYLSRADGGNGC